MPSPAPSSPPSSGAESRPPRRKRYRGTHPRRFDEKYKELEPAKYPEEIAKVRSGGKTPAGTHVPVMVDEVLSALDLKPGATVVDATLGYGGHAVRMLERIVPGGHLIGLDADPLELPKTEARLMGQPQADQAKIHAVRSNYAGMSRVLGRLGVESTDAVLADFGLSSMQIDNPSRGFSWKTEGPLDMRLNPKHGRPASELLATASEAELESWLTINADEPRADWVARAIVEARKSEGIVTTRALTQVIRNSMVKGHHGPVAADQVELTIRRCFQALRIEVNDEFGAIDSFLAQLGTVLKPGGRVAILTFHSGEDRRVKKAFAAAVAEGTFSQTSDGVIRPSPEEVRSNPRSSPAKLRWAIRSGE